MPTFHPSTTTHVKEADNHLHNQPGNAKVRKVETYISHAHYKGNKGNNSLFCDINQTLCKVAFVHLTASENTITTNKGMEFSQSNNSKELK
jgi:hypothetical protein